MAERECPGRPRSKLQLRFIRLCPLEPIAVREFRSNDISFNDREIGSGAIEPSQNVGHLLLLRLQPVFL